MTLSFSFLFFHRSHVENGTDQIALISLYFYSLRKLERNKTHLFLFLHSLVCVHTFKFEAYSSSPNSSLSTQSSCTFASTSNLPWRDSSKMCSCTCVSLKLLSQGTVCSASIDKAISLAFHSVFFLLSLCYAVVGLSLCTPLFSFSSFTVTRLHKNIVSKVFTCIPCIIIVTPWKIVVVVMVWESWYGVNLSAFIFNLVFTEKTSAKEVKTQLPDCVQATCNPSSHATTYISLVSFHFKKQSSIFFFLSFWSIRFVCVSNSSSQAY